jgi:sigma-B regulation protein RsbU (phosphoserine phosphatase)
LLDTELAGGRVHQPWSELTPYFQHINIPCLLFSSSGQEPAKTGLLPPWAADTILQPVDSHEVRFKIAAQLTIRRLSHEADLANKALLEKQRELEEYQRSAAEIQKALLPCNLPDYSNLCFSWRFLPCEQVGGDLFNVLRLDNDTVMAYLLDVSGHGISAAMVTVSVYQSLSPQVGRITKQLISTPPYYRLPTPAEVMQELEKEYPFERFGRFFTITYMLINIHTGRIRFCNAGHPPPFLVRNNGPSELLQAGGSIIGTGCSGPFEEAEIDLQAGDRLYIYSDGITEQTGRADELFGQERLFCKLEAMKKLPLDTSCEKIIAALSSFTREAPLKDDVTLMGIEYRK